MPSASARLLRIAAFHRDEAALQHRVEAVELNGFSLWGPVAFESVFSIAVSADLAWRGGVT